MASARDVAESAGVSVSTVSRALASTGRVSPATRDRVVAAAARLGYQPDPTARGLRMGRTHAIGLLVPDLENPYFASVTKGVQARARALGYAVFIVDSEEDATSETALVRELARRVDGVLLASPRSSDHDVLGLAGDVPTVLVSREVGALPSVAVDDRDGVSQALRHLYVLGHRRVAVAAGPVSSWSSERRSDGLRRAAESLDGLSLVELGAFSPYFSGGFAAADHVLAQDVTAVVAFNDLMALGMLGRFRERGVKVPDDVSVVGFDDVAVATLVSPALTTIRVPRTRLGRRAVDLLVGELGSEDPPARVDAGARPGPAVDRLPVELVVRGSTGAVHEVVDRRTGAPTRTSAGPPVPLE
ncbi:LacI family DNA-binding transcriptional regulator [Isoptericola sp. NPDC056573]|uniref:LacI family DNA-binding transcriptional regulator n=1 Tax=unclassified Isoptericola TaxID=2623355 RepID=UPI003690EF8E